MLEGLRWITQTMYVLMAHFCLLGSVAGTSLSTMEYSKRFKVRMPSWSGAILTWGWYAWAYFLALFLQPDVFDSSAMLAKYKADASFVLMPALLWAVGALGVPALVLFAGRWIISRIAMKRKEDSKSLPWRTFEPFGYRLNWPTIFGIPAVAVYDDDRDHPITTTVGDILREILPGRFSTPEDQERSIESIDDLLSRIAEKRSSAEPPPNPPVPERENTWSSSVRVKAPSGRTIEVQSIFGEDIPTKRFAAMLIDGVLKLFRATDSPSDCVLYFYEYDFWHYHETAGERHKFFVVDGDAIVLEDFELSHLLCEYFDKSVLTSIYLKEEWQKELATHSDGYTEEGEPNEDETTRLRWWYRRFYTETTTGRIKVFWNERIYNYVSPELREAERDSRLRRVEWLVLGITGFMIGRFIFKWF